MLVGITFKPTQASSKQTCSIWSVLMRDTVDSLTPMAVAAATCLPGSCSARKTVLYDLRALSWGDSETGAILFKPRLRSTPS